MGGLRRGAQTRPRLARRLVVEGTLVPLAHGLFAHLRPSRFGPVPPRDEEIIRAFLDGGPFVFTGPERWNALGLGTTAVFAVPLVYNTKRSRTFTFGNRRFVLRRVPFPENRPVGRSRAPSAGRMGWCAARRARSWRTC